jgi:hypothetical protein
MIGRLLGYLITGTLRLAARILVSFLYYLLGLTISLVIRLSPYLFRACVYITAWIVLLLDYLFKGNLIIRPVLSYLVAGGLWAMVGFLVSLLFRHFLGRPPFPLIPSLGFVGVVGGALYGLVCGFQVQRIPGWGQWEGEDGLQIGEDM